MKNITALAVLVIIAFSFAAIDSAYCQNADERDYVFLLSPQSGLIYGQALEYVYPVDTKGELVSELKWDAKPVFYLGLQLDFEKKDIMSGAGFFSSLSFKAGIPGDSGVMEDRDWLSIENGALTNFSSHINRTRQFFSLDASLGVSFPVKSWFYVKPFLSGAWMRFAFTGREGYGIYAREKIKDSQEYHSIYDNPYKLNFSGEKSISYRQDWLLFAIGVSAGSKILYPFLFEFSFKITPIVYNASRDEHLLRNITFLDYSLFGLFYEPSVRLSYSFKRVEHSFEFSYRHIAGTRGNGFMNDNNAGYYLSPNKTGAGLSLIDLRYLIKIRF